MYRLLKRHDIPNYKMWEGVMNPSLPGLVGSDFDNALEKVARDMNLECRRFLRPGKIYKSSSVKQQLSFTLQQGIRAKGYKHSFGGQRGSCFDNLQAAIAEGFITFKEVHKSMHPFIISVDSGRTLPDVEKDLLGKEPEEQIGEARMALGIGVPPVLGLGNNALAQATKAKKEKYAFDIPKYYKKIDNLDRDEQISLATESVKEQLKTKDGMSVHELNCAKEVLNFLLKVKSSEYKVVWVKANSLEIDPESSQHRKENHSSDHKKVNKSTICDRGVDRPLIGYLKNPRTGKVIIINGCHRTEIVQGLILLGKLPEDFKVPVYLVPNEQEFLNHWKPILEETQAWLNISAGTQAPVVLADVRKYAKRQLEKSGIDVTTLPKTTKELIKLPEYKRICAKAVNSFRASTLAVGEIKKAVTRSFNESLKGSNNGIDNFSDDHPGLKKILSCAVGIVPIPGKEAHSIPQPTGDLIGTVSPTDTLQVIYVADAVGSTPMQTYLEKIPLAQQRGHKTAVVFLAHNHRGEEGKIFKNLENKFNVAKNWYHHAKQCFGEANGNAIPDMVIVPNKIVDDCVVLIQGEDRQVKGSKQNNDPIVITSDQLENWFNSGDKNVPLSFMFRS
tara:strand:- start:15 stop:1865 length:1851 start_codon:yes stop_codon:yes gene_type:complete